jgi:hypothetical protein
VVGEADPRFHRPGLEGALGERLGPVARTWIVIDLGGPARPNGELLPSSPAGPDFV